MRGAARGQQEEAGVKGEPSPKKPQPRSPALQAPAAKTRPVCDPAPTQATLQ